jgi:hypothetical protein
MVTSKAYRHLGLKAPKRAGVEDLFEEPGLGTRDSGLGEKA